MQNHDTPKQCKKCGSTEWRQNGKCAPCERAYQAEWRKNNREKDSAYKRKWREEHREFEKELTRQRRHADPERFRRYSRESAQRCHAKRMQYQRQRRAANPERDRIYQRNKYRANRNKQLERAKQWRSANQETYRQYRVSWNRRNQVRRRGYEAKRRALKHNSPSAPIDYARILAVTDCYLCGQELTHTVELDHIIPLARGGSHSTDNILPTHPRCNRLKGVLLPSEASHLFPKMQASLLLTRTGSLDNRLDTEQCTETPRESLG